MLPVGRLKHNKAWPIDAMAHLIKNSNKNNSFRPVLSLVRASIKQNGEHWHWLVLPALGGWLGLHHVRATN